MLGLNRHDNIESATDAPHRKSGRLAAMLTGVAVASAIVHCGHAEGGEHASTKPTQAASETPTAEHAHANPPDVTATEGSGHTPPASAAKRDATITPKPANNSQWLSEPLPRCESIQVLNVEHANMLGSQRAMYRRALKLFERKKLVVEEVTLPDDAGVTAATTLLAGKPSAIPGVTQDLLLIIRWRPPINRKGLPAADGDRRYPAGVDTLLYSAKSKRTILRVDGYHDLSKLADTTLKLACESVGAAQ